MTFRNMDLKIIKPLAKQLFLIVISCVVIISAGGGMAFILKPVGLAYLVLWVAWWLSTLPWRKCGVNSQYDHDQRLIKLIWTAVVLVLVVAPPWEYAHFVGPIPRNGFLSWIGLVLFAFGIILQSAAMWILHGLYTSRLGMQPGHRLITIGPYRFVRHPGYLSIIICMIGIGISLGSLVAFGLTVLTIPFRIWRIKREEKMLIAEFGEEYITYMRKTKRLIPLIY